MKLDRLNDHVTNKSYHYTGNTAELNTNVQRKHFYQATKGLKHRPNSPTILEQHPPIMNPLKSR